MQGSQGLATIVKEHIASDVAMDARYFAIEQLERIAKSLKKKF
jgi:hypothetical protein